MVTLQHCIKQVQWPPIMRIRTVKSPSESMNSRPSLPPCRPNHHNLHKLPIEYDQPILLLEPKMLINRFSLRASLEVNLHPILVRPLQPPSHQHSSSTLPLKLWPCAHNLQIPMPLFPHNSTPL